MARKFVLYSYDFKPRFGGVAEYAFRLAEELHNRQKLIEVCAPYADANYAFPYRTSQADPEKEWHSNRFLKILANIVNAYRFREMAELDAIHWKDLDDLDVVLITSYYGEAAVTATIKTLSQKGQKYGLLLHGLDIIMNYQSNKNFFLESCKHANFLIFNSNATRSLFEAYFPGVVSKHAIMHPGIKASYLENLHQEPIIGINKNGKTLISFVGRLVKRKGPDLAVYAMQVLKNKGVNAMLVIAGEGPMENQLRKEISQLGLEDNVFLAGGISEEQKAWLFQQSDISLLPNRGLSGMDFEGFGISNLEAAFYENVTIGGTHGGVPEAISHEVGGYVMDFENDESWKALADKILQLINNPEKMKQMAQEGRRIAMSTFEWDVLVNKMLQDLELN